MAIDTSIYGILKPHDQPSILDTAGKAASLSALALQRDQMIRKNRLEDQELADQAAIKDAFGRHVSPDGKINQGPLLAELAKINPSKALELQSQFRKQSKEDLENQFKQMQHKVNAFGTVAQMAATARNQGEYERMIGTAQSLGLDTSMLPPQFHPEATRQWARMGFTAAERQKAIADQFAEKLQTEELGLKREKAKAESRESAMKLGSELRKERSGLPTSKATQEVSAAYNKVQAAAKNPSPAGDLALIFNYMKMLDPGSVVRESEFRSAEQARAWMTRTEQNGHVIPAFVKQAIQKADSGQFLLPEQRADFLSRAGGIYAAQKSQQMKVDKDFKKLAEKHGIDPKDVILNFEADQEAPKAAPPVRMIAPDGSVRMVPADQVDAAKAAGGRLAE